MKQIIMCCSMAVICIGLCVGLSLAAGPDKMSIGQAESRQAWQQQKPAKDLFDLIREDHQKIQRIFEQVAGVPGQASPNPREVLRQLKAELVPHMIAEESTLYAELAKKRATREIASKTMKEHQDLKRVLAELENLKDDEINSSPRIAEMRQLIITHVRNEETILFQRAKNNISRDQLAILTERFQQDKQKAMGRP